LACKIKYKESVVKDLKQIDKSQAKRILDKIDIDLSNNPGKHKPLTGDAFKDLNSYRVGNYRVIYRITEEVNVNNESETVLLILRIGHRKNVYD
jgi:addiction module RelE/StbE family toxin